MKPTATGKMHFPEFVALMAFIMCFVALSIDLMLPALAVIGDDLGVINPNHNQLVISGVFIGVAFGQLFYGPLSDAWGRKPVLFMGMAIYIVGTLFSLFAENMELMILGRVLQGFGAACPRTLTVAIVRDQYVGPAMARVMSLIMTVFILVPVIAPLLGQGVLMLSGWRAMFALLLVLALIVSAWAFWRMPESLSDEVRVVLSWQRIKQGLMEVLLHRVAMLNLLALGAVFGAFLGFLSSVQQILQETYQLGALFPFYFAFLALGLGVASYSNSRLVQRFGLYFLVQCALSGVLVSSLLAVLFYFVADNAFPLWAAMGYFMAALLCVGLLFGNLNAMIMESFGHIAGLASSLIGSLSTLIAIVLGTLIGQSFNGTVMPVVYGFLLLSGASLVLVRLALARKCLNG